MGCKNVVLPVKFLNRWRIHTNVTKAVEWESIRCVCNQCLLYLPSLLSPPPPKLHNMLSLSRKPFFTMISFSVSLIHTSCYLYLVTSLSLFLEPLFYLLLYYFFHLNLFMFFLVECLLRLEKNKTLFIVV